MRHRKHTFKIGRSGTHRRAMLANMTVSLITHGQIVTTLVRAKELRRFAERMVTFAKKGDLHHRRLALSRIHGETAGETAVTKLFDVIAPAFAERQGGYTRIIKLGQRRGDGAERCLIQLIGFESIKDTAKRQKKSDESSQNEVTTAAELVAENAQ